MGLYSVMLWCAEEVTPHWSCDEKPVYQQNTTRDSECKKGKRVLAWKWIIFPPSERCRTTTISTSPLLLFSPPVRLPTWVLFFVARHRRRPPLPLTAHCCENMERGELNCTWDMYSMRKHKKRFDIEDVNVHFNTHFFTLWFKQDSWINYWSIINQRKQHMFSPSKVFLLK